jgi:hypothetical protein
MPFVLASGGGIRDSLLSLACSKGDHDHSVLCSHDSCLVSCKTDTAKKQNLFFVTSFVRSTVMQERILHEMSCGSVSPTPLLRGRNFRVTKKPCCYKEPRKQWLW